MPTVPLTRTTVGPLDLDAADALAVLPLLGSLAAGLLLWPELPAEMAVHFSGGRADSYMSRSVAVWLVPVIGLAAVAYTRRKTPYAGLFRTVYLGFVGWVVAGAHLYVLAWNLGYQVTSLVVAVPAAGGAVALVALRKTGVAR
ncbi:MAG: DUF1648 domain-containing protein [Haloarculaceae archaeon]